VLPATWNRRFRINKIRWEFTMEKNNSADSCFYFKPMVGGRITSGARKHKLFNEVRLDIGDFELPLQFEKIEATNLVKRTIEIKWRLKPTYFHFFALKSDNLFFCHWDIPTRHNGYCVSNAVDYAKKNGVLPTILSTFSLDLMCQ